MAPRTTGDDDRRDPDADTRSKSAATEPTAAEPAATEPDGDRVTESATGPGEPARPAIPNVAAQALVFFTSGVVLVIEILAARMVAPFVGNSLQTYSALIGVVLAGIAVGTRVGGRLADRRNPRPLLGPVLLLSSALTGLTLPVVAVIGPAVAFSPTAGAALLALVALLLPAAALSAVSPMVVKLQLNDLGETGDVVSRLSAAGTVGALVGTFLTGFVLLAAFSSRHIILGLTLILAVVGILIMVRLGGRAPVAVTVVWLMAAGLAFITPRSCQYESTYFCASVVADPANPNGRRLVLDDLSHSYVDLADPGARGHFRYMRLFQDVTDGMLPAPTPVRGLHIGGGGYSMPRYLSATRRGSTHTVLELDPKLADINRRDLQGDRVPDLRLVNGDARLSIGREPDRAYDLVVGDAFGRLAAPWHLTTREFIVQIDRVLAPDGVYMMNIIDGPAHRLISAEARTLKTVFPYVTAIAPPHDGNWILIASHRPIRVAPVTPEDGHVMTPAEADELARPGMVLTDDYAPVDQLLSDLERG